MGGVRQHPQPAGLPLRRQRLHLLGHPGVLAGAAAHPVRRAGGEVVTRSARLAVAALGLLGAAAAFAQHTHGGHGAAPGAAPRVELGASATFDARGVLWAVSKDGGRVVARHSEDLGRSWSAPQPVSPEAESVAADGDARPKIAAGSGGELYVTWT